jgi:hypothetical protein
MLDAPIERLSTQEIGDFDPPGNAQRLPFYNIPLVPNYNTPSLPNHKIIDKNIIMQNIIQ